MGGFFFIFFLTRLGGYLFRLACHRGILRVSPSTRFHSERRGQGNRAFFSAPFPLFFFPLFSGMVAICRGIFLPDWSDALSDAGKYGEHSSFYFSRHTPLGVSGFLFFSWCVDRNSFPPNRPCLDFLFPFCASGHGVSLFPFSRFFRGGFSGKNSRTEGKR